MRFDVKDFGELDVAVHDYREAMVAQAMILVFHTPGGFTYRFIVGEHGIERQECTVSGDAIG